MSCSMWASSWLRACRSRARWCQVNRWSNRRVMPVSTGAATASKAPANRCAPATREDLDTVWEGTVFISPLLTYSGFPTEAADNSENGLNHRGSDDRNLGHSGLADKRSFLI